MYWATAGVTLTPPEVVKVGVRVTDLGDSPGLNRDLAIPVPRKSALVLPAGIVKSTVRPPDAN